MMDSFLWFGNCRFLTPKSQGWDVKKAPWARGSRLARGCLQFEQAMPTANNKNKGWMLMLSWPIDTSDIGGLDGCQEIFDD
jgi:hypothetical protein